MGKRRRSRKAEQEDLFLTRPLEASDIEDAAVEGAKLHSYVELPPEIAVGIETCEVMRRIDEPFVSEFPKERTTPGGHRVPLCALCGEGGCHIYSARLGSSAHYRCYERWLEEIQDKDKEES